MQFFKSTEEYVKSLESKIAAMEKSNAEKAMSLGLSGQIPSASAVAPPPDSSGKYLPLESNPDMLTSFIRTLGVAPPCRFIDVWSFDEETLGMFSQPIVAVCVLYPCGNVDRQRLPELTTMILPADGSRKDVFYIKQRQEEVGNACGTIAVVHSICNNLKTLSFLPDSPLLNFGQTKLGLSAESLADELGRADFLHVATTVAAAQGQTATPSAEDEVNSHFITFVRSGTHMLELDGAKPGPVDHGECAAEELFARAVRVVREDMMPREPGNLNFCVLALTTSEED